MEHFFIYIHTNTANEKKYVGVTTQNPERRWRKGRSYNHNSLFTNAINKYGWESFKHDVWEVSEKEMMFLLEEVLIDYLNTTDKDYGYNLTTGGETGPTGFHHSEEWKSYLSKTMKKEGNHFYGKHLSEEAKQKLREAQLGRVHTEESKKKVSMVLKGRFAGKHHPFYGKTLSDETKEKMKLASSKAILQFDKEGNFIKEWNSTKEAGNELGICPPNITMCLKGRSHSAGGYVWKYKIISSSENEQ